MIKLTYEMKCELAQKGRYRAQRYDYLYDNGVVQRRNAHGDVVEERKIDLLAYTDGTDETFEDYDMSCGGYE